MGKLEGKRVLVIGSGIDLNDRCMQKEIDDRSGKWDAVIRVNNPMGTKEDTGTRTDYIFCRYPHWADKFPAEMLEGAEKIATWQGTDFKMDEFRRLHEEVGHRKVSCGLLAVYWASREGASEVAVIGFGWNGKEWAAKKEYPDGRKDNNPEYDWNKEHVWVANHATLL